MQNIASKRQKKLFHDKNIWVSVLIVSAPAFILGFMSGLFAFCDQLMMVKFIPEFMNVDQIWQNGVWDRYNTIINEQCTDAQKELLMQFTSQQDGISTILRTSVAYSAPITVLINAAALLLGNGTAINYSKYSGAKNLPLAERTWTQGFWGNMILSIIITVVVCGGCQIFISIEQGRGLTDSLNNIKTNGGFNDDQLGIITQFYDDYYEQIRIFASQYIYIMGGACIFCLYSQFITYLVIAEGRQTIVVLAAIFCNGLNILLDFVLIKYGKLAMIGGAVATDIGWLINTGICFGYVYFLQRRNDTNLNLASLKKINFHFKDYGFLFALGLPSFARNLSMAIATVIQMSLIVNVITRTPDGNVSEYQNIYGAVNAVYNLSFTALFGIINGSRIICSYNHGAGNFKRVRSSYLVNIIYAIVYGLMMYFIICYGASTWLLSLFDINKNSGVDGNILRESQYMLQISMLQMPIMAIGIGGMTLFQATGRWWQASIAGIMQGVICSLPISFLMQWICIRNTNINLFLWVPLIIASIATLINLIWSVIYIKLHFQDKHVQKILNRKN